VNQSIFNCLTSGAHHTLPVVKIARQCSKLAHQKLL